MKTPLPPTVDRREILRLAAEADADPRSIERELRAMRGEDRHVRGRAGERVRAALASRGIMAGGGAHA
jgi:hypothetical protein